jgi:hypothetical protein
MTDRQSRVRACYEHKARRVLQGEMPPTQQNNPIEAQNSMPPSSRGAIVIKAGG